MSEFYFNLLTSSFDWFPFHIEAIIIVIRLKTVFRSITTKKYIASGAPRTRFVAA